MREIIKNDTSRNEIPATLLTALERHTPALTYTRPTAIYYLVWMWGAHECCGVYGDGPNGSYEWFYWRGGKLETSNCGYGSTHVALRDVLTLKGD